MTEKTSAVEQGRVDAGVHNLEHYRERLPDWRFFLREHLIPFLRWETPYLAAIQQRCRTPTLDAYFAFTANLGTHTFYMIMLPVLIWCGHLRLARAMSHMLAGGVFISGFVKDLFCLPRPLSPPLQRITRSPSAALEYGFPSTHSTNALSVVVYAVHAMKDTSSPTGSSVIRMLLYMYATSIVFGRVYCGMHGFIDVVVGSSLGVAIALVQMQYGDVFDEWIYSGTFQNVLIVTLIILILVRIHPEPADDCPCFDDSVAFSGVFIGLQLGGWQVIRDRFGPQIPLLSRGPIVIRDLGYLKAIARIFLGVLVIFVWRGSMKPLLLKVLPPIFRVVEKLGLSLPRRFFLRASEYRRVPPLRKDDNVIPSASDIPSMITSLRNPRKRTVSVGAQSEADVYEALAYREWQRRSSHSAPPEARRAEGADGIGGNSTQTANEAVNDSNKVVHGSELPVISIRAAMRNDFTKTYDNMNEKEVLMTAIEEDETNDADGYSMIERSTAVNNNVEEKQIFHKIAVPRVRYDVEVVTKLVVYTGIGWLAIEFNPILYELIGLGIPR